MKFGQKILVLILIILSTANCVIRPHWDRNRKPNPESDINMLKLDYEKNRRFLKSQKKQDEKSLIEQIKTDKSIESSIQK